MTALIVAGSLTLALWLGVRAIFGVALGPFSENMGWPRGTFALPIAPPNLV